MKKFLSMLLCMVMVLSLTIPAQADSDSTPLLDGFYTEQDGYVKMTGIPLPVGADWTVHLNGEALDDDEWVLSTVGAEMIPVTYVCLVDHAERLGQQQQDMLKALSAKLRGIDRMVLVHIAEDPELQWVENLSTQEDRENAVNATWEQASGRLLYKNVQSVAEELAIGDSRRYGGNVCLIILSNGDDASGSPDDFESAKAAVRDSMLTVYTVGLLHSGYSDRSIKNVESLEELSDGVFSGSHFALNPKGSDTPESIAAAIFEETMAHCVIGISNQRLANLDADAVVEAEYQDGEESFRSTVTLSADKLASWCHEQPAGVPMQNQIFSKPPEDEAEQETQSQEMNLSGVPENETADVTEPEQTIDEPAAQAEPGDAENEPTDVISAQGVEDVQQPEEETTQPEESTEATEPEPASEPVPTTEPEPVTGPEPTTETTAEPTTEPATEPKPVKQENFLDTVEKYMFFMVIGLVVLAVVIAAVVAVAKRKHVEPAKAAPAADVRKKIRQSEEELQEDIDEIELPVEMPATVEPPAAAEPAAPAEPPEAVELPATVEPPAAAEPAAAVEPPAVVKPTAPVEKPAPAAPAPVKEKTAAIETTATISTPAARPVPTALPNPPVGGIQLRLINQTTNGVAAAVTMPKESSKTFGRNQRANCVLAETDSALSAVHFEIRWDGASLSLRDLNATNSTFVEGMPLKPMVWCPLRNGSIIQAGSIVYLVEVKK